MGDLEQYISTFYSIAGYKDLYILGAAGLGRKQIQILNRLDNCCFGQGQHDAVATGMSYDTAMRGYEQQVRIALYNIGSPGFFRLEIDEAAPAHTISWNAIVNVILAELNGGRRYVGAPSPTDAFVRGLNGNIWHYNSTTGFQDTGLATAGVPAAVAGAVNPLDVFYRDNSNQPRRAYKSGGTWVSVAMGGVIITDPVAISWGPGRYDVVAIGTDYRPYHWWWNGSGLSFEGITGTALALGPPALASWGSGRLDVFFRGWDRGLYHVRSNGSAPWTQTALGGTMFDFPTAVGVAPSTLFFGAPSASLSGGVVYVHARTSTGNLGPFQLAGSWSFANNGGGVTGSPTSTAGQAHIRGTDAALYLFNGSFFVARGGLFD